MLELHCVNVSSYGETVLVIELVHHFPEYLVWSDQVVSIYEYDFNVLMRSTN